MSFEITCGECSGQLLVESGGVVVECPLCGAHLSIPEFPDEAASDSEVDSSHPPVVAEPTSADSQILAKVAEPHPSGSESSLGNSPDVPKTNLPESDVSSSTAPAASIDSSMEEVTAAVVSNSNPVSDPIAATQSVVVSETESDASTTTTNSPEISPGTISNSTEEEKKSGDETSVTEVVTDEDLAEESTQILDRSAQPGGGLSESPSSEDLSISIQDPVGMRVATNTPAAPLQADATTKGAPVLPPTPSGDMVPRQQFILVAGYASAVTLALLYMLFVGFNSKPHFLESLPDLVPEIRKDGAVGMPRVLPQFDLPPGHDLQLGETQRFGNLKVTPIKITRGPLEFVHMYGNKNARREPSQPVMKLWLRFENVSSNQEFPPLDRTLVFRRIYDPKRKEEFALTFLCPEDQRTAENGDRFFVYDMPEFSEFDLSGQRLNRWLSPGETWETYIPSDEAVTEVKGPWVWRVLLRKGLNSQSGRGVTTLVDVHFQGSQVEVDG